jgi:putative DNA primase/helicase
MDDFTGKWHGILTASGIPAKFLTGKHTACPMCGGTDRFRFDNKEGKGTWICNQCRSGNGFKLLMLFFQMEFNEVLKLAKEKAGIVHVTPIKPKRTDAENQASNRKLWEGTKPLVEGDFVAKYLNGRGITLLPKMLRKHPQCYSGSHGRTFPAMLGLVKDMAANSVTIHRTYLTLEGSKAEVDNCRELMSGKIPEGAAIQLMKPSINLGIAEGIETALSAAQIFGIPVWGAISAVMMEKWIPPEIAKNIFIFGDNDANYTGQKAAYALANKLAVKGLSVQVHIPASRDWNDELRKGI